MKIEFEPIGYIRTDAESVPRHWTVSDVRGRLEIDPFYVEGIRDFEPGSSIVVLFYFHKSPAFEKKMLVQKPPHKEREYGVFSICSPKRPNGIGLSVVQVESVEENIINVRGIDMIDGTPIIDIKPHIERAEQCPSHRG